MLVNDGRIGNLATWLSLNIRNCVHATSKKRSLAPIKIHAQNFLGRNLPSQEFGLCVDIVQKGSLLLQVASSLREIYIKPQDVEMEEMYAWAGVKIWNRKNCGGGGLFQVPVC